MAFEDTVLIVVGDSFVYGHYGDDMYYETCWQRSWVSKLGKLGKFKEVINLGEPGGSNKRSLRVIIEYITKNYDQTQKYFVLFGVTDISRTEFPVDNDISTTQPWLRSKVCNPLENINDSYKILSLGVWHKDNNTFNSDYYEKFYNDQYEIDMLNYNLLLLYTFFKNYNIDILFFMTVGDPKNIKKPIMGATLPRIIFHYKKNNYFMKYTRENIDHNVEHAPVRLQENFRINEDIMTSFVINHGHNVNWCGHFDHDGNEFLANYIYYEYVKGASNGL
jgi:hypothetical protein